MKRFIDSVIHFFEGCKGSLIYEGPVVVEEKKNNPGIRLKGIWKVWICRECENTWAKKNA